VDGWSFPSGHATGTAATALLSAWMLSRWLIGSWAGRVMLWAKTIGVVLLIGFSRVYLGVHYVSDVLAGWLLGTMWAGVVMLAGSWWDDARRARGTTDSGSRGWRVPIAETTRTRPARCIVERGLLVANVTIGSAFSTTEQFLPTLIVDPHVSAGSAGSEGDRPWSTQP
jgi:hypothetical protein